MADILEFELSASYQKALKEVDDFINKVNSKFKGMSFDVNMKSTTSGGKSPIEKATEDDAAAADKRQKQLDKLFDSYKQKWELFERRMGVSVKDIRNTFYTEFDQLEQNAGNRSVERLKKMGDRRLAELQKLARSEAQLYNKKEPSVSSTDDSPTNGAMFGPSRSSYDKSIQDANQHAQKMEELRQRSALRIQTIENRIGAEVTSKMVAERTQAEQTIEAIISSSRTPNIKRIMITQEIEGYQRAAQAYITNENIKESASQKSANTMSKNSSRGFSQMYQLQQAVEDFSYAGFRGASNNIAFMLAQMGESAGGAAAKWGLLGVAIGAIGVSLGPVIYKMAGYEEQAKKNTQATELYIDSLTRLSDAQAGGAKRGREAKSLDDVSKQDKEIAGKKLEMQENERLISSEQTSLKMLEDIKNKRKQIDSINTEKINGRNISDSEWDRLTKEANVLENEVTQLVSKFKELHSSSNIFDNNYLRTVTEVDKAIETYTKRIGELKLKNQEVNVSIEAQSDALERQRIAILDAERAKGTSPSDIEKKQNLDPVDAEKARHDAVMQTLDAQFKINQASEDAIDIGIRRKILEQETTDELRKHREITDELTLQVHERKMKVDAEKEKLREAVDIERDRLQLLKAQNREKESAIKHEETHLQKLEDQKFKSKLDQEEKTLDSKMDFNNKHAKDLADQAKDWDKQANPFVDKMFGPGARERRDKMIDDYFAGMAQRGNHHLLQEQINKLGGDADQLGKSGKFEEQRKKLEDLNKIWQDIGKNTKNPGIAKHAFGQVDKNQGKIDKSFEDEKKQSQEKIDLLKRQLVNVEEIDKHIKEIERTARQVRDIDPVKEEAITRARRLREELNGIGGGGEGKKGGEGKPDGIPEGAINPQFGGDEYDPIGDRVVNKAEENRKAARQKRFAEQREDMENKRKFNEEQRKYEGTPGEPLPRKAGGTNKPANHAATGEAAKEHADRRKQSRLDRDERMKEAEEEKKHQERAQKQWDDRMAKLDKQRKAEEDKQKQFADSRKKNAEDKKQLEDDIAKRKEEQEKNAQKEDDRKRQKMDRDGSPEQQEIDKNRKEQKEWERKNDYGKWKNKQGGIRDRFADRTGGKGPSPLGDEMYGKDKPKTKPGTRPGGDYEDGLAKAQQLDAEMQAITDKATNMPQADPIGDGAVGEVQAVNQELQSQLSLIQQINAAKQAGGGGSMPSGGSMADIPKRARGGTVGRDRVTMVGENGPELFMPNQNGYVLNNTDTSQLLGTRMNSFNSGANRSAYTSNVTNSTMNQRFGTVHINAPNSNANGILAGLSRKAKGSRMRAGF